MGAYPLPITLINLWRFFTGSNDIDQFAGSSALGGDKQAALRGPLAFFPPATQPNRLIQ